MLLIATDEAGYGPKLGPLVIVATVWRLPLGRSDCPSQGELDDLFANVRGPVRLEGSDVVVDDSKSVYQSRDTGKLNALHAIVSAALNWTGHHYQDVAIDEFIRRIASADHRSLMAAPWMNHFSAAAFLSQQQTAPVVDQWSKSGIQIQTIAAKIITAKHFNEACDSGMNKADLLSESTLALVRQAIDTCGPDQDPIEVFCDRHGGRRYYGGVLQHTFEDSNLAVHEESKQQSTYRFAHRGNPVTIRFTVKGDSFTPVALSSIIAKYLRERMMESFNAYFRNRHSGAGPLKPTAGYPVDADRFLSDIEPIIQSENIDRRALVRQR